MSIPALLVPLEANHRSNTRKPIIVVYYWISLSASSSFDGRDDNGFLVATLVAGKVNQKESSNVRIGRS